MTNIDNKVKLLLLWDILCRMTDEEHLLNTDEIIELLFQKGINVSKKILRDYIKLLNEYGFEVMEVKKKYYFYYVANKPFKSIELAFLVDSVSSSKLNDKQKETLIDKLANTLDNNRALTLLNNVVCFDKSKYIDSNIIYNIDKIDTAINDNKKISFLYFSLDHNRNEVYKKDGKRYLVNPFVMVFDNTHYYLLCYDDKHFDTITYRIDRITDILIESENRLERSDLKGIKSQEYKARVLSIFGGKIKRVELQFNSEMIDDIFDKFGEEIAVRKYADDMFSTVVAIQTNKTFYMWVAGSQGGVKICSPTSVKAEFQDFVDNIKRNF